LANRGPLDGARLIKLVLAWFLVNLSFIHRVITRYDVPVFDDSLLLELMCLFAEASFSRWTRLQSVSQRIVRVGNYGFAAYEFEVLIVSVELILSLMLLFFILNLDDDWMRAGVEEARREFGGERICAILLGPTSSRVMRLMKALLVAGLVTHGWIHGVGGCGARIG